MKLILRALEKYRRESIIAPLFKMAEALLDLFVPLIMAEIIDFGIASGNRAYILSRCGLLLGLAAGGLLISITAQFFAAKAAVGASTEIRHDLFEKIMELGFGELDEAGTGTLLTRLTSDVNQVQNVINLSLRLLLRSPFIVFGAAVMAIYVDRHASAIFLLTIPLLAAVIFTIMKLTRPMYRSVQGALDTVSGILHENLTGVRVVRAFGRSESEKERFRKADSKLLSKQLQVGRTASVMNPVAMVIVNLAIVAILSTGSVQVQVGTLTQGAVIALVNYMNQILVELVKLADLVVQIARGLACADRVESVLAMQPSQTYGSCSAPESVETGEAAVEFENVSFRYRGSAANALEQVSFKVKAGEMIGIIGGTGSAKSTLVNLIPRYYDATEGTVRVFGRDVREYDRESLRAAAAFVPQKTVLFRGTIRTNLLMGREDASDAELWEALDAAQASEFVRTKEGQLDAEVHQGGRNFSGGQRQRLAIARAFVSHAPIMVLDDSLSALDYATDAALRKALRSLPDSVTVFLVSQRAASVMAADRILVLDDGEIAGMGSHEELLASSEVYREICRSQNVEGRRAS